MVKGGAFLFWLCIIVLNDATQQSIPHIKTGNSLHMCECVTLKGENYVGWIKYISFEYISTH